VLLATIALALPFPSLSQSENYSAQMVERNKREVFRDVVASNARNVVDGNVMLFWDWRWVYSGYPNWTAPPRVRVGMMTTSSTDPMPAFPLIWGNGEIPVGLRLEAQRPAMEMRTEGDTKTFPQLQEDGVFKSWAAIKIPEATRTNAGLPPDFTVLTYLESRDLKNWTGPSANSVTNIKGLETMTNIVAILPTEAHGTISIFKDPSAPPEERYKLMMVGVVTHEAEARYRQLWPKDCDRMSYHGAEIWGIYGGVSPDGLRWKMLDLPVSVQLCDTPDMPAYYDTELGKYVFYGRTRYLMYRANMRLETADFRHFPLPEIQQFSGGNLPADHEWYSPSSVSRYPGTTQYHVMLPLMWRKNDDTFAVYMATSLEGKHWSVLGPGPIMEPQPGPIGRPGACGYHARQSLLEFPDGKLGVMVQGFSMPHKYPYRPSHPPTGTYWATWPRDRLVALVAEGKAEFRTPTAVFQGDKLVINCRTKQAGSIRVQVRSDGQILRSFEDCEQLTGDFSDHVVTWKKNLKKLGHTPGASVIVELRMEMAELFSLRFR
jgi:hypothetical protein